MTDRPEFSRPYKCECGITLFRHDGTRALMTKGGAGVEFVVRDPFIIWCGNCRACWHVDVNLSLSLRRER